MALDTGHDEPCGSHQLCKTMESHQHRKIGCLEEIAAYLKWLDYKEDVLKVYEILKKKSVWSVLKRRSGQ